MSSQKKTFREEQAEIQSHSSRMKGILLQLQIFCTVCLNTARTCGKKFMGLYHGWLGEEVSL